MPAPRISSKTQTRERPTYNDMLWEQSQDTKNEVRETRKELNVRMDNIEQRMDKLDTKIDATRRELNERIDKLDARIDKLDAKIDTMRQELTSAINDLRNSMQSSTNHGQIATISTVGIALGVLYSIFSK